MSGVHIHGPAAAGATSGIVVDLCGRGVAPACATGTVNGVLVSGIAAAVSGMSLADLLVLFRNETTYVNVHTAAVGGGEIRGQVTPQ